MIYIVVILIVHLLAVIKTMNYIYIYIGRGIEPVRIICSTVLETGIVIVWFMSVCSRGFRRLR